MELDINERFLSQIVNDCLYKNLYNNYKNEDRFLKLLCESGAIEENRTEIDDKAIKDYSLLTLPLLDFVQDNEKELAIIVSTGSFSPMHKGHVDAMNIAKEYVENKLGYQVIQGVMSLSHDNYVAFKNNGIAKSNISIRTDKAYEAIKKEDWLTIDRLEGEMVSCAINFSTVLNRVKNYIQYHNHEIKNIKVFYVFGSDNASFSYAFIDNEDFQSICVERNGSSFENVQKDLSNSSNIHFLENKKETANLSSTLIRKLKSEDLKIRDKKQIYFIRTDGVTDVFAKKLKGIVEKYVNEKVEVKFINSDNYIGINAQNTISLDKFIKTEYNLDLSREFQLCGSQKKAKRMVSISAPIEEQISCIKKGDYCLLDDDSVSGFTLKKTEEILKKHGVNINSQKLLIKSVLKDGEELYDVIDARDFCLNADNGGLVVKLFSGDLVRVPYIFPFVNLTTRANIKPEYQIQFSYELLLINEENNTSESFDTHYGIFNYINSDRNKFINDYKKYFENYLKGAQYDN